MKCPICTAEFSPWISVKERMPENGEKCDTFADNERVANCEYYEDQGFTWGDDFYIVIDNVTHWMPIPEPPKEES